MSKIGGFYRSGAEVEIKGGEGNVKVEKDKEDEKMAPLLNSIDTYAKVMD